MPDAVRNSASSTGDGVTVPRAISLLVLNVLLGASLLLCMTPIYGSIPTYVSYSEFWLLWAAAYFSSGLLLERSKVQPEAISLVIGCWPLGLHYYLFPLSSRLGPALGPFVTQAMTLSTLNISSSLIAMHAFLEAFTSESRFEWVSKLAHSLPPVKWCVLGLLALMLHGVVTSPAVQLISRGFEFQGDMKYPLLTRASLLHFLSFAYYMLCQKRLSRRQAIAGMCIRIYAVFMLGFSSIHGIHERLEHVNYKVLDSQDSNTGYISVVQNMRDHFQVLRSDHSLLGGIWLPHTDNGLSQAESVYPVFHMLEAVRLVECELCNASDAKAKRSALVIGLGIGTAPAALSAHGINTTVVEIDPVVVKFARKYFGLPANITYVKDDAMKYVARAAAEKVKFDYIIHDVFTGGAEPAQLFTLEFLRSLRQLLNPQGAVAINYAGNLQHASTMSALKTICLVFGQCRVYRDSSIEGGSEQSDTSNLVAFAHASGRQWKFREPAEADFLASNVRRKVIPPQLEVELEAPATDAQDGSVLQAGKLKEFKSSQYAAACEHWKIMRKVMPAVVWETV